MSIYEYDEELHKKTLHDEGYEDGFQDGFNDGFHNGALSTLIEKICRKLQKSKTPAAIADELEEDFDTVNRICEVAKTFAPEYNVKEIIKQI